MTSTTSTASAPATRELDERCINAIRFLAVDAVEAARSGHVGTPMGAAPMAYLLWDRFLKHNPTDPDWPDRDRYVLSAGHASMLLYSLLHLTGYPLTMEDLQAFRQWGSRTPGHPEHFLTPGVETTTGPLGQGVANAVGMALAEEILANTYNRPGHEIINHRTYVQASDGDMQEGIASEAASLAGSLRLGKLTCLYDDNGTSIDGPTSLTFREDVAGRFRSYGWHVVGPVDGLDLDAIQNALQAAREETDRPSLVIVKSTIGYGNPKRAGTSAAHDGAFGEEETQATRDLLGWEYPPFVVPPDVTGHMREAVERGRKAQGQWHRRLTAYRQAYPAEATALERDLAAGLPPDWDADLDSLHDKFDQPVATRTASGAVLAAVSKRVPSMVGGSADLAGSNKTIMPGRGSFQPENRSGRNIHFGVREHAMGGISNGIAYHGGLNPFAGTFLVFSDYMRAAVRLAALGRLNVIFIYSHDSVGVGQDGPTHQPIAELMGLRLMPNLVVIRPADAHETVEAWRIAMTRRDGPVALIFSRQDLPLLSSVGADVDARGNVQRGAYVVKATDIPPDIILIATGSEVQHALGAAALLSADGIQASVVSMPSWELFDAQPDAYREQVLPRAVTRRLAVEAGTEIGWERYVGLDGAVVGMTRFGASAHVGETMKRFGFTADNVASKARQLLKGD